MTSLITVWEMLASGAEEFDNFSGDDKINDQ
jgi:hypothetical protein